MTIKVKDLIKKLEQCNPNDDVELLVNHYNGGSEPIYSSTPILKTEAEGTIYIIEGDVYNEGIDESTSYYTKDMITLE